MRSDIAGSTTDTLTIGSDCRRAVIAGGVPVVIAQPDLPRFTQLVLGDLGERALALDAAGTAYWWGDDELVDPTGHNPYAPFVPLARPPLVRRFVEISAFFYDEAVALLSAEGAVFVWGDDYAADGGVVPGLLPLPPGVRFSRISGGDELFVGLTPDGEVYAIDFARLGRWLEDDIAEADLWCVLGTPAGVRFVDVCVGSGHVAALDADGHVHLLWYGPDSTAARRFVALPAPDGVRAVQLDVGAGAVIAVGDDGGLYRWAPDLTRLTLPGHLRCVSAATNGFGRVFAVGHDGSVHAWGLDAHAGQPRHVLTVPSTGQAVGVHAGGHCAAAISSDGEVVVWDMSHAPTATPRVIVAHDVAVTAVLFGGTPGTGLVDNGDWTWTVVTPPHPADLSDVRVEWSVNGVAQRPIALPGTSAGYGDTPGRGRG